jgi:hypothetical protein
MLKATKYEKYKICADRNREREKEKDERESRTSRTKQRAVSKL